MANIRGEIQISPKSLRKLEQDIRKEMIRRTSKFLDIFIIRMKLFSLEITKILKSSSVVKYLKTDGVGQLGIIDVDAILEDLYKEMNNAVVSQKGAGLKREVSFSLGELSGLRVATRFIWTSSGADGDKTVNLFSLIEDGTIAGAGYQGFKTPSAAFLNRTEISRSQKKVSRTGEGLMVKLGKGRSAYRLPESQVKGFSRAILTSGSQKILSIIKRIIILSMKQAGFSVKGGI